MSSAAAAVLTSVASSFAIMFIGYGACRSGWLGDVQRKGIALLYAQLVFPMMVFKGVAAVDIATIDARMALVILLSKVVLAILVIAYGIRTLRPTLGSAALSHAAAFAMAASHSFDVTLGVPLAKELHSSRVAYVYLNQTIQLVLINPLLLMLMDLGDAAAKGSSASVAAVVRPRPMLACVPHTCVRRSPTHARDPCHSWARQRLQPRVTHSSCSLRPVSLRASSIHLGFPRCLPPSPVKSPGLALASASSASVRAREAWRCVGMPHSCERATIAIPLASGKPDCLRRGRFYTVGLRETILRRARSLKLHADALASPRAFTPQRRAGSVGHPHPRRTTPHTASYLPPGPACACMQGVVHVPCACLQGLPLAALAAPPSLRHAMRPFSAVRSSSSCRSCTPPRLPYLAASSQRSSSRSSAPYQRLPLSTLSRSHAISPRGYARCVPACARMLVPSQRPSRPPARFPPLTQREGGLTHWAPLTSLWAGGWQVIGPLVPASMLLSVGLSLAPLFPLTADARVADLLRVATAIVGSAALIAGLTASGREAAIDTKKAH